MHLTLRHQTAKANPPTAPSGHQSAPARLVLLLQMGLPPAASRNPGQIGIWMASQEAAGGIVIDERVAGQPLDGPAPGADIAERVPRWQQAWMLIVELVLEAAEGTFALDGPRQPASGAFIGNGLGEVGHVLVPDPGRQRIDETRPRSSRSAGAWPSMPVPAVQNAISPVRGSISHRYS